MNQSHDRKQLRGATRTGPNSATISPTWSPDGSQILFALDPTNEEFTHPDNTFDVIHADGTDLQQVIGTPDFKRWPEWWE
jgi:Tol biopolymer transport system component